MKRMITIAVLALALSAGPALAGHTGYSGPKGVPSQGLNNSAKTAAPKAEAKHSGGGFWGAFKKGIGKDGSKTGGKAGPYTDSGGNSRCCVDANGNKSRPDK